MENHEGKWRERLKLPHRLRTVESAINQIIVATVHADIETVKKLAMNVGPLLPYMVEQAKTMERHTLPGLKNTANLSSSTMSHHELLHMHYCN